MFHAFKRTSSCVFSTHRHEASTFNSPAHPVSVRADSSSSRQWTLNSHKLRDRHVYIHRKYKIPGAYIRGILICTCVWRLRVVFLEHGGGALGLFISLVCTYLQSSMDLSLSASHYLSFLSKRIGRRMPPAEQSAFYRVWYDDDTDTQNTESQPPRRLRQSDSAQQHTTYEFATRRNTIAKPTYHWNSPIISNCRCRHRIVHKYNQHPPCSVLETPRYHTLHPNKYTINILPVKSISSLRNEREIVLQCHNDSRHFRKLQTEFRIPTINSKSQTKFRIPNTKCQNLQELMYCLQYQNVE